MRDEYILEVDEPASPYSCNNYIITVAVVDCLFARPAEVLIMICWGADTNTAHTWTFLQLQPHLPTSCLYLLCSEEEGGGQGGLLNIANWDVVDQYSVIELM